MIKKIFIIILVLSFCPLSYATTYRMIFNSHTLRHDWVISNLSSDDFTLEKNITDDTILFSDEGKLSSDPDLAWDDKLRELQITGDAAITGDASVTGKLTVYDGADAPLNITERGAVPTIAVAEDIYMDDGTNTASGNPGWRRYTGAAWEDVSATAGGATAWDNITNPTGNDEIDFGAHVIELNVGDFRVGDGGANYWKWADGAMTNAGTATINIAAANDLQIGGGQIDYDDMGGGGAISTTSTLQAGTISIAGAGNSYIDDPLMVGAAVAAAADLEVGDGTASADSIDGTNDILVKDDVEIDDDLFVDDDAIIAGILSPDALVINQDYTVYGLYDKECLIFEPDNVNDEIAMLHVDADLYPNGIKLINVQITLNADAAYSMVFEEWAGDPPAAQNDIETVTTGGADSYMEVRVNDIDDSDIDADDYIFLDIPATDVDWIHCKVIYYVK